MVRTRLKIATVTNFASRFADYIFRSVCSGIRKHPFAITVLLLSILVSAHYSVQLIDNAGTAYKFVILLLFVVLVTRIVFFGLSIRDISRISAIVAFGHLCFALLGPWQFILPNEFGAFASNRDEANAAFFAALLLSIVILLSWILFLPRSMKIQGITMDNTFIEGLSAPWIKQSDELLSCGLTSTVCAFHEVGHAVAFAASFYQRNKDQHVFHVSLFLDKPRMDHWTGAPYSGRFSFRNRDGELIDTTSRELTISNMLVKLAGRQCELHFAPEIRHADGVPPVGLGGALWDHKEWLSTAVKHIQDFADGPPAVTNKRFTDLEEWQLNAELQRMFIAQTAALKELFTANKHIIKRLSTKLKKYQHIDHAELRREFDNLVVTDGIKKLLSGSRAGAE